MANVLKTEKRVAIVSALVEGNSIRATARMVDVSKDTVMKLAVDVGAACSQLQAKALVNLPCKRVEVDEIWSFIGCKAKNVPAARRGELGIGDAWTFTAIDAETKLCVSWLVGSRDSATATEFMQDVASRLAGRVQLSTDGHTMYLEAVSDSFASGVDYAMVCKVYGAAPDEGQRRYSPAICTGAKKRTIFGKPNLALASTSYVERQNLTMRMSMRRFTRLTNAFSKKLENHVAAVALHFAHYNFCRIHQTLRVTPAMAAGVSDHVWSIPDLVNLLAERR